MVVIAPLIALFVAAFLYKPASNGFSDVDDTASSRILLLTAHPDDEAMFFAPTLLALRAKQVPVQVQGNDESGQVVFSEKQEGASSAHIFSLCLSNGNADGLGSIREKELHESLDILGVASEKRWIIDNPELQDNITLHWDPLIIAAVVRPFILEHEISTILTFDHDGVSKHPNHKALSEGVKQLVKSLPDSIPKPRLFALISVPKWGKYVSVVGPIMAKINLYASNIMLFYDNLITEGLVRAKMIPVGSIAPSQANRRLMPVFISGLPEYRTSFEAMLAHRSQLVWFRWLYLLFSRYMWINEWVEVN